MQQPYGFIARGQEHKACKLQRFIYGLKQASRTWNIRFDQDITLYGFEKSPDEPCVYKRIKGTKVVFLVFYVDDILLIENDIEVLSSVKRWLQKQFDMKDLEEANCILGIKLLRDRKNKVLALSQALYIDKILASFSMENFKKGTLPLRHGVHLSKEQSPKTLEQKERMSRIPFSSVVGSLMYAMLCTRPDFCYAVGIVSRYQSDLGEEHLIVVKHILKYIRRTRDYMLVYSSGSLETIGYTNSDFQGDIDSENLVDPFTKTLPVRVFEKHVDYMGVKSLPDLF